MLGGTKPVAAQSRETCPSKFQGQSRIFQSAAVKEKRRKQQEGTGRRRPEQILGAEERGQARTQL